METDQGTGDEPYYGEEEHDEPYYGEDEATGEGSETGEQAEMRPTGSGGSAQPSS